MSPFLFDRKLGRTDGYKKSCVTVVSPLSSSHCNAATTNINWTCDVKSAEGGGADFLPLGKVLVKYHTKRYGQLSLQD